MRCSFKKILSGLLICGQLLIILPIANTARATLNESDADGGDSGPTDINVNRPFESDPYQGGQEFEAPGQNIESLDASTKPTLAFSPSKIAQKFDTDRIILNASDRRDLEQFYAVSKALPDLESDLAEFSALTGRSVEDLERMYNEDFKSFSELQRSTEDKYFNNEYIKKRLIASPEILSEVLGAPIATVVESIKDEPDVISAEIDDILQYQFDRRVIQTLIYLITPKNLGGAGHWKVRVYRLRRNYDRENNKWSRESEVAEEQEKNKEAREEQTIEEYKSRQETKDLNNLLTNSGYDDSDILLGGTINDGGGSLSDFLVATDEHSNIISAHASGQAIDISELDDFRCTLVKKRRVGGDQKTPQAPSPLKLQWQTKEGYAADKERIDSSFNDMFLNMSQDAIVEMLAGIDIDFETLENMDSASFSDIAAVIGQAFLSNAINSPSSEIWKFDLEETLRKLGGVILADKLSLDRAPFIDTNVDSITRLESAIGRYAIEKKLELPYGSLAGNSRDEILIRIGKTRLADELHLPTDVFDMPFSTEDELFRNIGSRLVEETLGFPDGSFNHNSLNEVKDALGKYKLDAMLKFPSGMDSYLGLPDGTTERLKNGSINVREYNRLVAEMHLNNFAYVYPQASGGTNLRDEMFNLPEGTIAKLLAITISNSDYERIGIYSLAHSLEASDEMRCSLEEWLRNPNPEFRSEKFNIDSSGNCQSTGESLYLPRSVYSSTLGITIDQVYKVLGSGQLGDATGVYKRLGERILIEAVKNSSMLERRINEYLIQNPQIGRLIEEFEFYFTRIENIKNYINEFRARSNEVQALLNQINDPTVATAKQQATLSLAQLLTSLEALDNNEVNAGNILDIIASVVEGIFDSAQRAVADINQFDSIPASRDNEQLINAINALNASVEGIAKNAYEIISGTEQNDFRLEDLSIGELADGVTGDLILLLSGKISVTDYLVYWGSKKLGEELNLPPKALKYAAIVINHFIKGDSSLKDAFFRGIGLAQFEQDAGIDSAIPSVNKEVLGGGITIGKLREQLRSTSGFSQSRVDEIILGAFGLRGYSIEPLMRGDFGAWSTARAKAEEHDRKSKMPIGTTESFIRGKPLGDFDNSVLSEDEIRMLSTRMNVSEPAIESFVAARDGDENPAENAIYFVDHNQYRANRDTGLDGAREECVARDVPDNSYLYYDRDGLHYFNSYAAANEYRRAHADRELNYIEELALGLVEVMVATQAIATDDQAGRTRYFEQFKNQLTDFISSQKARIDGYDEIRMRMVDMLGFSPESVASLFTRDTDTGGGAVPIDFLKIYGYSMLEHFAVSFLNSYLDISFGPSRLTPDDFFEIMNGNARSVFARIGGAMLDEELGLERGTIREILESTNSAQRKCAMERAAMQLLGDFLNIPGLKLDGSIFDNFGGGKIEKLLGLPEKSFKGKNLDELIASTGKLNFIKAFRIPVSAETQKLADDVLRGISADYYDTHKSKDFYGKAEAINIYFDSLGKEGLQTTWENLFGWIALDMKIDQSINMLKSSSEYDLWGSDQSAVVFYLENSLNNLGADYNYSEAELINLWHTFRGRIDAIDANLMLDSGTTKGLLTGKISPDDYRKKTSDKALFGIGIDLLLSAFGLDKMGVDAARVTQFIDTIKNLGKNGGGSMFVPVNGTTPAEIIYGFLSDLFSFNLDNLAHFTPGTIEKILVHPERALPVLLREGAIMLDRQLGLGENIDSDGNPMGDGHPSLLKYLSLTQVVNWLYGTEADYEFCTDQSFPNGAYNSYSDCMNARRQATIHGAIRDNAVTAINNLIRDIDIRVGVDQADGSITVEIQDLGITLPVDKLAKIFEGDMRPVAIVGIAMALEQIFGDANGTFAPNDDLRFTVEDIVAAFYGDPAVEAAARARAEAYIYANENGTNGYTEANPPADPSPYLPHGSQEPGSTASQTAVALSVSDLTIGAIEEQYPITPGANTTPPPDPGQFDWSAEPDPSDPIYWDGGQFNSEKYQADYAAFQQSYYDWNQRNHDYWLLRDQAREAGDRAVADSRRIFMEQLQYRISDCLLQKLDPRIPAGFTWAMYKGSDFVRTTYILAYLENWMRDSGFFDFMPPEFQGLNLLNPIYAFIHGDPNDPKVKGNWDILVSNTGVLDALDQFLVNRSPTIMGMSLEPGTAGAIYAFIKTGSTSQDYQGLKSLSSIYSTDWITGKLCAWADKALGLPSGTMGQMYNFYKQFKAIQMISRYSDVGKLSQALGKAGLSDFGIIDQYSQYLSTTPPAEQLEFDKWKQSKVDNLKADLYAAAITFIVQTLFAKQIASFEQALGLVPGSGGLLVAMAVNAIFGVALTVPLIMFVALNLFGFYKTEYLCTPDGYYPVLESPPDSSMWDVSGIGYFDALKPKIREAKYIESAQYKANRLIGDLLEMPAREEDEQMVPTQIMTGRREDVWAWAPYIQGICDKVGGKLKDGLCSGTKAGIWANPQTTSYTHIGF